MKKSQLLVAVCGALLMLAGGSAIAQGSPDQSWGQNQQQNGHGQDHHRPQNKGHGHAYGHDKGWRGQGWYKRGGHLPTQYRGSRYVVTDWRSAHLRQPPRGYHWVRSDNGDFLLVAITTGVISSIIASAMAGN